MKLTQTVIELMFELSSIEGDQHSEFFDGEGQILRNNLLELFKKTDNPESQEIIIDIMSEAGYPWFGKLARSDADTIRTVAAMPARNDGADQLMSDDEFMELLPANGRIH